MKLEKGEYEILTLDHEGYTLTQTTTPTLKQAKTTAKCLLTDPELKTALQSTNAHKIEIRNNKGECIEDYFFPPY